MSISQAQVFEDRRWAEHDQVPVWRHEAALQLVSEEPVLDVAGGDGLFLSLLQKRHGFSHLMSIDFSSIAVEKARSKGLEAAVVDITQPFPFDDDSFGTACALDVLEHLYEPLPTLKEMGRVARSVVLVVPNFHYWKGRLQMLFGQVPFQCKPQRGHVHWFNYSMFRDLITRAGLKVDTVMLGGIQRLGSVGNCLARCHPNLFADSFAVRAKKA